MIVTGLLVTCASPRSQVRLTGAEESYLLLLDEVSGHLYLRAQANLEAVEAGNFQVQVTDSPAAQVVQTGQPLNLSQENSPLKVKTGLNLYALLNVPVSLAGQVIGVLGIFGSGCSCSERAGLRPRNKLTS